jgi:hypothetical protein
MNHTFGHLKSCFTIDPINKNKPYCKKKGCCALVCRMGCLERTFKKGKYSYVGYCQNHYNELCDDNEWDMDICKCLNIQADKLKLTIKQRHYLGPDNVILNLQMPAAINQFSTTRLRQIKLVENAKKNKYIDSVKDIPVKEFIIDDIDSEYISSYSSDGDSSSGEESKSESDSFIETSDEESINSDSSF